MADGQECLSSLKISDKQISGKGKSNEPSRECISMLAKQNDELKQENLILKRHNDYLKERLNVISFCHV